MLLDDVSMHSQQTFKKWVSINYVQYHMFSVNCHMTRAVYFLVAPLEEYGCIKVPKQKLGKLRQNKDFWCT